VTIPKARAASPEQAAVDARRFRAVDVLKDGARVTFRAVTSEDRKRIVRAFHCLEPETIYSRFFAFKGSVTDAELDLIASFDFVDDVMLVATIGDGDGDAVIGAGSYHVCGEADERRVAEVAFVVEEDYQGLGIARRLLAHLVRIARVLNVSRFDAEVLAGNQPMLRVFQGSGLPMTQHIDGGTVHVSLNLTGRRS
jgi:GNAT superfamily N-acetyltransferase